MTDKFEFEWRKGDKCKWCGGVYEYVGKRQPSCTLTDTKIKYGNHEFHVSSLKIKPHGTAKKRYKAEKIAWQQSRIKVGDWVRHIGTDAVYCVESIGSDGWCHGDVNGGGWNSSQLKPCKPPKPESNPVIETEHFRVDGSKIVSKMNGKEIISIGESTTIHISNRWEKMRLNANNHRELAEILDKVEASRKP